VRRFDLVLPESVEECVRALVERGPEAKVVAGGTDLLPQLKNGLVRTRTVIDLSGVPPLGKLGHANGAGLRIGAAVAARTLERDPDVARRYSALAESAALVGSVQIRNLATLGVIAGPRGTRRVPFASFFTGVRRTVLTPDELLVEIVVPAPGPGSGGSYRRHTPRRELDIAVVGVASQLTLANGRCTKARIALAAVAPTPVRAMSAERLLEGHPVTPDLIERAAHAAVEAARPISDQRGSADFRRHLVQVLTRRTLTTALARAGA
jgi:carbon-monoxide dehydrogenase medium subunit